MNKEMIIDASDDGVEIALLENKKLVELHYEQTNAPFAVGDLYLGKVKKLMPGLNAAFVDVGYERDAFLHYTDLSPYVLSLIKFTKNSIHNPDRKSLDFAKFKNEEKIVKSGKIVDVLKDKPEILVQILKEPISTKGPRLSCEISLPGRFVVLTPFNNFISISRKIHSAEERKRLENIVESIKPPNFGVIVRTAAEGMHTAELHADLMGLTKQWQKIQENLFRSKAPKRVLSEQVKTNSIIRDLLNDSFQNIVTNHEDVMLETKNYISKIAPEQEGIVNLYSNGRPIFDHYGVTKQVKAAFGKTVNMQSGAYLVIEHTEALHVIDVNSGTRKAVGNQEESALSTNLEAAEEVARQLRLRDLGGIIIVDFIDMRNPEHKRQVQNTLTKLMKSDRAKHTILPITRFGLLQITRQRLRPEIKIATAEMCPQCKGTGKVGPSLLISDELSKDIHFLINQGHKKLQLTANPILIAYLKDKGIFRSIRWKWYLNHKVWVTLKTDNSYPITEYYFHNKETKELIHLK